MMDNYANIIQSNLDTLYANLPQDLARYLPADRDQDRFKFTAFGEVCTISRQGIAFDRGAQGSVPGILVSLYALNANDADCDPLPYKAFKEFPDTLPYSAAFATHTEQLLVPHVDRIKKAMPRILNTLNGQASPREIGGDFSFVVYPLPKIALCYIFYSADEDFPAAVTCLYSRNAQVFMPMDGLADVGEYTSKKILECLG